jgi:hypothetical protein|tara:strand:- start:1264 stop:1440 length:177 start_codon:yes stop_codon:yes gene_type:complete
MENSTESIKPVIDGISATLGVGVFFGYIQALVGIFTIVWFAIRIWETKTVQGLINKRS